MCHSSLYREIAFFPHYKYNQPAHRQKDSYQMEVYPHAVTLWEECCGDGQTGCAQCSTGSRCVLGNSCSLFARDRLAGAARAMCAGNSSPALQNSPCYKMQLLLFWHFTQLSAPKFLVSNPSCFVLPSFLGQHCLQYRVPCLAHHLPVRTIVMIFTTAT